MLMNECHCFHETIYAIHSTELHANLVKNLACYILYEVKLGVG